MNIFKSKRFIAAALTFVLVMALAGLSLPAKERRGATVEVTMTDGSKVKGELLAVRSDALLVFDREVLQGKSLDLPQVAQIKLLKKSKFLTGLAIGLGVGLGIAIGSHLSWPYTGKDEYLKNLGFPFTASMFGGFLGQFAGIPEKFSLDRESSQNVQQNLERLKRYAREQDTEKLAVHLFTEGITSNSEVKNHAAERRRQFRHRFRLVWSPGHQNISGNSDFGTENGTFRFVNNAPSKDMAVYPFKPYSQFYPQLQEYVRTGRLRLEYELTPHFSPSLEITSGKLQGAVITDLSYYSSDYAGRYEGYDYISNIYSYTSLLLGLNWKPFPPSFAHKYIIELGVAAGLAQMRLNMDHGYRADPNPQRNFRDLTWSYKAHTACDYFYTESFSLGFFVEYQYLQASFPSATFIDEKRSFALEGDYRLSHFTRPTEFTIPKHDIQLGGITYGLRIGLRF